MEHIIQKAIEGGYEETEHITDERDWYVLMRPEFWKALQKSSKWEPVRFPPQTAWSDKAWLLHAQNFHHINLTEGWDAAITYLTNLIKS